MASIEVKKSDQGDSYGFQVTVRERGGETHHRVTLRKADYERLAGGKASPEALVTESFQFLLERERKESILGSFDLTVISRYFPEYKREIAKRLWMGRRESPMQYRTFGKLDWKPSALGFGTMRFPVIDDDPSRIDELEATRMLHYAIDHGVNYVDTAYTYHHGTCEAFLGRALQDGYRQRVKLATKLPSWLVKAPKDLDRYLNEQLERLQTETIDFYLLHGLNEGHWPRLRDLNVLDWAEKAMADGRIRYLGFSFHDRYEVFQEIVDAYDRWTFCQIQYNYMDEEHQAGTRGLKYAADKGLAVVVMEPIRGGQLARTPPRAIMELWDTAACKRTPADWALQWVWNHPEVSLVLSGMSTLEQVEQNVASASQSGPGTLTADELALITRVRDKYRELYPIPCTQCKYCLPCPSGVNIPRIFEIHNDAIMYNDYKEARAFYNWLKEEEKADSCNQCAQCEELCPQAIEIVEELAQAHQLLGEDQNQ